MDMTGYTRIKLGFLDQRTVIGEFPGLEGRFSVVTDAIAQPQGGHGYLCQMFSDGVYPIAWISGDFGLWACQGPLQVHPLTPPVLKMYSTGETTGIVEWRDPVSGSTRVACEYTSDSLSRCLPSDHHDSFHRYATIKQEPRSFLALCYLAFVYRKSSGASVLESLRGAPLPDAIDSLVWRVQNPIPGQPPSGLEAYAARLFQEAEAHRLRSLVTRADLSAKFFEDPGIWWFNFDSDKVTTSERSFLMRIEQICNRIARLSDVLVKIKNEGADEGSCSELDWDLDAQLAARSRDLLSSSESDNGFRVLGATSGQPGGEWDIRTRVSAMTESIRSSYRVVSLMDVNLEQGVLAIDYLVPDLASFPSTRWHGPSRGWFEVGFLAPIAQAQYAVRMGVLSAAIGFGAAMAVNRVIVNARPGVISARPVLSMAFDRPAFYNLVLPALANEVFTDSELRTNFDTLMQLIRPSMVHARLGENSRLEEIDPIPFQASSRFERLSEDPRPLPDHLRDFLRADSFAELDPLTTDDVEDRERLIAAGADVEESPLLAIALAEEVVAKYADWSPGKNSALYWEEVATRVMISMKRFDPKERFVPYPIGLARAHLLLARAHRQMGEHERSLEHAKEVMKYGPTEPAAFLEAAMTCNATGNYPKAADYLREAATICLYSNEVLGTYYQLAVALDGMDMTEPALACLQYIDSDKVQGDIHALMQKLGREEKLSPAEIRDAFRQVGIHMAISDPAADIIQRAAVELVDAGCYRPVASMMVNISVLFRDVVYQSMAYALAHGASEKENQPR